MAMTEERLKEIEAMAQFDMEHELIAEVRKCWERIQKQGSLLALQGSEIVCFLRERDTAQKEASTFCDLVKEIRARIQGWVDRPELTKRIDEVVFGKR